MDLIGSGCALIESLPLEGAMRLGSALGHGAVAGAGAAAIVAYGAVRRDPRMKRVGLVALLAVVASGILVNVLKVALELPRPNPRHSTFGFPSGHTSTAFALAGVLGWSFPPAAPLVHLGALLTGLARVYLRAHFAADVLGGAVAGSLIGLGVSWRLLPSGAGRRRARAAWWPWALLLAAASLSFAFFLSYERQLAAQRRDTAHAAPNAAASSVVAFGSAGARPLLVSGWSADERWENTLPFVWAEGREAVVELPALPTADHRLRLLLQPHVAHEGLSCQRVELAVNGVSATRLLLERGWHRYEVAIPARLIRPGPIELRFRFAYAGSRMGARTADARDLSVAFGSLEARPAPQN